MSSFPAQYIIFAYLYVSLALLAFNVLYILWVRWRGAIQAHQKRRWCKWLKKDFEQIIPAESARSRRRQAYLRHRLSHLRQLMAFVAAAETFEAEEPEKMRAFFDKEDELFLLLARDYGRRESMEKAYYAWVLGRFHLMHLRQTSLMDQVFGYLVNTSIYCRENVLNTLYASGSVEVVEKAYQFLQNQSMFHSRKLLSDGLLTFRGDQQLLAQTLWQHREWNDELRCSIVQFITRMDPLPDFSASFLETIRNRAESLEVRLAIIRYFARFKSENALPLLLGYAREEAQVEMAIVAASALRNYPCPETIDTLTRAVCSTNWYVRANAASSLIALKAEDAMQAVLNGTDRFARDMLLYQMQKQAQ